MKLRDGLPPLPRRMRALPLDARGYPVPFFVLWRERKPDFRSIDTEKLVKATRFRLCWICGEPLGRIATFAVGPLSAAQGISSEPPSHPDCAHFAVRACPFMLLPRSQKSEPAELPRELVELKRNPGVYALWSTHEWEPDICSDVLLFRFYAAERIEWFAQGRHASHEEVVESILSGVIEVEARIERDPKARAALNAQVAALMKFIPAPLPRIPSEAMPPV